MSINIPKKGTSQQSAAGTSSSHSAVTSEQTCASFMSSSSRSLFTCRTVGALLMVLLAVLTSYLWVRHTPLTQRRLLAWTDQYLAFWRPAPLGHHRSLGWHAPPLQKGVEVLEEFPHPTEFYRQYVRPQRPVLFRGLAKRHPAFHRWTDDYLREKFGKMVVDVEVNKKEDPAAAAKTMPLEIFLSRYKERGIYAVDSVHEEFKGDMVLPRLAQCGGLQHSLFDVVLWFSSGSTKSDLHYDELDNINCLLDGSKRFFLVDVDDADHIDFGAQGLHSSVDVESVDMYLFPGMRDVPWYNVTVEKGDCFYLPYKWPHHVLSSDSRNLAVNMWFLRLLWHNETDCHGKTVSESPLSDVEVAERPLVTQVDLIGRAVDYTQLTLPVFTDLYQDVLVEDEQAIEAAFNALDADGDGIVTLPEMYQYDTVRFIDLFPRDDDQRED